MPRLLDMLGIRLPIVQAPMAGVSTPEMAAAVSNADGLGSVGVGNLTAEQARTMIRSVRQLTDRPFNVNVFCHRPAVADAKKEAAWIERLTPYFHRYAASSPQSLREIYKSFLVDDAMLAVLLEERPRVVSFHFGLPSAATINALHQAGVILLATATNLCEAQAIAAGGVDAIVSQGYEAGGHRGVFDPAQQDECLCTMALTRLLVNEVSLPIIAAGGIMNGADIASYLAIGSAAAQLGTAFVGCPESAADKGYRAALFDQSRSTLMTSVISGRPARCLSNLFTTFGSSVEEHSVPSYPIAYDAAKQLHAAATQAGENGFGPQWAGTAFRLVRNLPAAELMTQLTNELMTAVRGSAASRQD